jgi:hypothetical protein
MKILFLVGATSRIRNFDRTITLLAERGHTVQLTGRLRKGSFDVTENVQHPRVSARVNPTARVDEWQDLVDLLRGARDYLRYFDPRFASATRLVRRAYEIAPTDFVLFCERHPWIKRHWTLASTVLAYCERLIPADPGFEAFVREEKPDLILVTPLVTFESYQTDYVKVAHRLGIPIAFIPFSWDNLTNKGLMRIHPDRVLVWNDVQRREAIDLHGSAPDSVVVTGAARFDDFFARTPSTSRPEFCARFGLDPARPLIVYLGSSQLTGPNEMELIRRWAESIRSSEDDVLRTCGILVRPHPALCASWTSVDLSHLGQISISLDTSRGTDPLLFDSLHHAHVAVGLNTSAMLEAAIVGRPVHTLVIPGFDEGQIGTMHFHYLVEAYGGLATIATDLAEHRRQLSAVLRGDPLVSAKSRGFAEQFLRPHGIDRAVSPILASEIERAASVSKRPRLTTPLWHYPMRSALKMALRRRRTTGSAAVDASVIATSMSLRPVKIALEEIQNGTSPVFVGPWLDRVDHELLYWIPFVRWVAVTYGLPPERLIVISNGNVGDWYGSLARRFLDARTLFSSAEFQHWKSRTVPQSEQDPKQAVIAPFDHDIVERASRAFDVSEYQVLHPLMFFRVLRRLLKDRALDRLQEVLRHESLAGERTRRIDGLPRSFVAVSAAFTDALPNTPDNQAFLADLVEKVSAKGEIVLVDYPAPNVPVVESGRVHVLASMATDENYRELQTSALAQAAAFVGSHGDLAMLAAFCRTPAQTYHSERLPADQLDRVRDASQRGSWAPLTIERARRFKGVRLPVKAHA